MKFIFYYIFTLNLKLNQGELARPLIQEGLTAYFVEFLKGQINSKKEDHMYCLWGQCITTTRR
jgi:hypothetical protein